MRHLAAYILLVVGGNLSPSAEEVALLLDSAGIAVDPERLSHLIVELKGKGLEELVALGKSRLDMAHSVQSTSATIGTNAAVAMVTNDPQKRDETDTYLNIFGSDCASENEDGWLGAGDY